MWLSRVFVIFSVLFCVSSLRTQLSEVFLNHYYLFNNQNPPEIYNVTPPIDRIPFKVTLDYSNPSNIRPYFSFPLVLTPSGRGTASLAVSSNISQIVDGYFTPILQNRMRICSIAATYIDRCGRLWILDSGLSGLDTFKCAPKFVVVNKDTYEILHFYEFPYEYQNPASRLVHFVVDEDFKSCRDFMAIASDLVRERVIVYQASRDRSWIVTSKTFLRQPTFEVIHTEDITISFPVGVFSLALTPPNGGVRYCIYTVYTGDTIYRVPTKILYNARLWKTGYSVRRIGFKNNYIAHKTRFVNVQNYFRPIAKTNIQIVGTCDIDRNWIMFCGAIGGIIKIDLNNGFQGSEYIVRNSSLELISQVKIIKNPRGENEIFALQNSMLRGLAKPFDPSRLNFGYYGCLLRTIYSNDDVPCTTYISTVR